MFKNSVTYQMGSSGLDAISFYKMQNQSLG